MPFLTGSSSVDLTGYGVPGSLLQPIVVTLGDFTLGAVDAFGVEWSVTSLEGWFEPAGSSAESQQRAGSHGSWSSSALYEERSVSLSGSLKARSFEAAYAAYQRFAGSIPLNLATMQVSVGGQTLQAQVKQGDGDLLAKPTDDPAEWEFSIPLLAPDPRRYGAAVTASTGLPRTLGGVSTPMSTPITVAQNVISGVLTVTNDGNVSTPPVLTVLGPCPPCSITHLQSGRVLRVPDPIAAGRSLVIDMDSGLALMDGTEPRVVTGSPFEYVPGVNTVAFGAATFDSGALLSSVSRSAWR